MDCPVCRDSAMITMELDDVEVDHCLRCGGIWLDAGELEMLLGDSRQAREMIDSFEAAEGCRQLLRRCPICRRKMEKILAGSGPDAVLLDRCRRGDGIWFDRGELHAIFEQACLDPEHKVKKLLAEMFCMENPSAPTAEETKP